MQDLKSIKSDCTDVFVCINPLTSIPTMYIANGGYQPRLWACREEQNWTLAVPIMTIHKSLNSNKKTHDNEYSAYSFVCLQWICISLLVTELKNACSVPSLNNVCVARKLNNIWTAWTLTSIFFCVRGVNAAGVMTSLSRALGAPSTGKDGTLLELTRDVSFPRRSRYLCGWGSSATCTAVI